MRVDQLVRELGGIVTTAELLRRGASHDLIRMSVNYRRILRIRKGWFANLDIPHEVLRARRAGGRLACVSALEFYGLVEPTEGALHIAVPRNSSRLRPDREVRLHWTEAEPGGDRTVVSLVQAWKQARTCPDVTTDLGARWR